MWRVTHSAQTRQQKEQWAWGTGRVGGWPKFEKGGGIGNIGGGGLGPLANYGNRLASLFKRKRKINICRSLSSLLISNVADMSMLKAIKMELPNQRAELSKLAIRSIEVGIKDKRA